MTTYQLQLQHTPTQSAAGNWAAVATVLTTSIVSPYTEKRSYNEVLATLGVSDMEHTLAAFSGSEIGRDGRQMLVTVGLNFGHSTTVALVNQLQAGNALRPGVASKLLALGTQTTQLAPGVTADQCRDDWQAGVQSDAARSALELLQLRRQAWDTLSGNIRSQIESGSLPDNAAVVAFVSSALGV